jgi:ATP-binding cassette subfamily B protein
MGQFNQPLVRVGQIVNLFQSTIAAGERVFEFLDEKEEERDILKPKHLTKIKGEIEFKNVKFGYEEQKPIIKDFSVKINS